MALNAWQKEWNRMQRMEYAYIQKGRFKKDSRMTSFLSKKIPENMQNKLNKAFAKAFEIIFEKGTSIIEKTYDKDSIDERFCDYKESADNKGDLSSLRKFSKSAGSSGNMNLLLSGGAGIGMGLAGIGIPDIAIFTGTMLKGIYQVALHFGYEYESEEEKFFILKIIEVALSFGKKLDQGNDLLNQFIVDGLLPQDYERKAQISLSSASLSSELLYMKFLQTIPLVGVVGGAFNAVYMKKILKYAKLKYHRRFLLEHKK